MKNMTNPYAEWFEQLRSEYGEQLRAMPLPDGLPEHLRTLINAKDEDAKNAGVVRVKEKASN